MKGYYCFGKFTLGTTNSKARVEKPVNFKTGKGQGRSPSINAFLTSTSSAATYFFFPPPHCHCNHNEALQFSPPSLSPSSLVKWHTISRCLNPSIPTSYPHESSPAKSPEAWHAWTTASPRALA